MIVKKKTAPIPQPIKHSHATERAEVHVSAPEKKETNVVSTSILFFAILILTPFAIDFFGKLFVAIGAQKAATFFAQNLWLGDVLGYLPIYLLILFYIKTTFNPLSDFGYTWNKQYLWWAVYIGVGSGLIIFGMDYLSGIDKLHVESLTTLRLFGYLLSWVLLPALAEETLFRGVIQNYYQKNTTKTFTKHNIHIAVFIGVIADIIFHLATPIYFGMTNGGISQAIISTIPQLIYVAVFGFLSGIMYQRTNSLVGPFIIHALGNLIELILIWKIM